jgi:hypothetical protein
VTDGRFELANLYGLTDGHFIANQDILKANVLRVVAQDAAVAGRTHADYVTQEVRRGS